MKPSITRAKFIVAEVTTFANIENERVKLTAVTRHNDHSIEGETFWNATPAGSIEMFITNPAAVGRLRAGQFFYVDFIPAE